MKRAFILSAALFFFSSCVQSQVIPLPAKEKPSPNEAVATFSEGCFWHAEIVFQSLKGVRDAVSGYAGGKGVPTYSSAERTGYAETVQVYYDPSKISYETLVNAFFASMDPTELNRQGNDEGTQYRSIAFYRNAKEKQVIDAAIRKEQANYKAKIVTEVVPYTQFYPAEAYHQEYIHYHPNEIYVAQVSVPEFLAFKKKFKADYKY